MTKHTDQVETPKEKGHERSEKVGREASDGQHKLAENQKEESALNKAGKARGGTRTWDRPSVPSGQFPEQTQILSLVGQKDLPSASGLVHEQVAKIENGSESTTDKLKKEQTYFDDLAGELRKGWEWNKQAQTLKFDLTQAYGGTKDSGVVTIPLGDTVFGDWLSKRPLQDRANENPGNKDFMPPDPGGGLKLEPLPGKTEKHQVIRPDGEIDTVSKTTNLDGSSVETTARPNGDKETTKKDKQGRETEHSKSHKGPFGDMPDEVRKTNYDTKTGLPETTTTKYDVFGRESEKTSNDMFGNSHDEKYKYGSHNEKVVTEETDVDCAKGTSTHTKFNDQRQPTEKETRYSDGREPDREAWLYDANGKVALHVKNNEVVAGQFPGGLNPPDDGSGASRFDTAFQQALSKMQTGDSPILIAQGLDNQNVRTDATNATTRKPFELGAEFENVVDQNGVVPFGEQLSGGASDSKIKSNKYYSMTVGFETSSSKGVRDDVLNINIGDGMKVNGQSVMDGKPHRAVFPINVQEGGHFHWVDATVQYVNGKMQLTIHNISASKEKPTSNADWNQINMGYVLQQRNQPQHISSDDYSKLYNGATAEEQNKVMKKGLIKQRIDFKEQEYKDY
jgi:hypothetical protein